MRQASRGCRLAYIRGRQTVTVVVLALRALLVVALVLKAVLAVALLKALLAGYSNFCSAPPDELFFQAPFAPP